MLDLVARKIIVGQAIDQQRGLAKSEAQAFAGDGVHSAGGVSDERNIFVIDVVQSSGDSNRSALAGGDFCMLKASGKLGKICKRGIEPQMRIRADESEADFIGAYGRDIDLTIIGPVQLHEAAPGSDTIMAAKSEASFFSLVTIEAHPAADA